MPEEEKTGKFRELRNETVEKVTALITSALGLVAALAWNSAILKLFQVIFGEQSDLVAMFVYATAVTVVAVFIIIYFTRLMTKLKG